MKSLERLQVLVSTAARLSAHAHATRAPTRQRANACVPSGCEVVCRLGDIPDGGVVGIDLPHPRPLPLVLRRCGASVDAWLNVCPADGHRMEWAPGRFLMDGAVLRCANRGALFALDQGGACVGGPCRGQFLVSVPVRVERGSVTLTEAPPVIEHPTVW